MTNNSMTSQSLQDGVSGLDLLPCPFCQTPDPHIVEGGARYYVACANIHCFCAVGEGYDRDAMPNHIFTSEADAALAWNNRK